MAGDEDAIIALIEEESGRKAVVEADFESRCTEQPVQRMVRFG